MIASQLQNYINPRPHFNTTQFNAWALARRCMRFTRWNLLLRFMPPIIVSVAVIPVNIKLEEALIESPFDPTMFMENGFLYEQPLNHSIRLQPFNCKYSFVVNAGYLANNFLESERQGYEALRKVITIAKEIASTTYSIKSSPTATGEVQEEGPTDE